ncbi:hypothetical protein [Halobacillus litoralis]|uniref:Uncharacterized protein n=1 Tax=Halobacillus litoralis TaxID=45668 RepID=A0A410MCK9_9BACI|nr:hypothetical protein [Halobacillus litoralis]QAS52413.1 hypothetical protein HLI_09285 [Halobacillus litoralis]
MNNLDNYLIKDIGEAVKLTKEFWSLTDQLQEEFAQGDLLKVKMTATRMIDIAEQLEFLKERKENHVRLKQVSIDLESQGITVAMVSHAHE